MWVVHVLLFMVVVSLHLLQSEAKQIGLSSARKGSKCKVKVLCAVMGGSCVTKTTLCDGKLFADGCKGKACQCCIPDIMEMLDDALSKLGHLQNSSALTVSKLVDTMEHQDNIEMKINNLTIEVNNMKDASSLALSKLGNLQNASSLTVSKLVDIMEQQGDTDSKIDGVEEKLSNISSNIHSQIENLDINITKKLDCIICHAEPTTPETTTTKPTTPEPTTTEPTTPETTTTKPTTPEPTTTVDPSTFCMSSKCYKVIKDQRRTWSESKSLCEGQGFILPQPADSLVLPLRKYLVENYADGYPFYWMAATTSDGSKTVWQSNGVRINSALFNTGYSNHDNGECLEIIGSQSGFNSRPQQPYATLSCSSKLVTLCEVSM